MKTEFQAAIAQLIHEKGLPQDVVMEAVANALLSAFRKTNGGGENVRIEVVESGDVRVWATKRVVTQVTNPTEEISLGEAQLIDPHAALGQHMEVDSPQIFNRIPAQTAKQVILQRIREAEQDHLFESNKAMLEELVFGTVVRRDERDRDAWVLDLDRGKIEGVLPPTEQVRGERLHEKQGLRIYVYDLRRGGGRGVQALVSRTHRNIVKRLFELEVPGDLLTARSRSRRSRASRAAGPRWPCGRARTMWIRSAPASVCAARASTTSSASCAAKRSTSSYGAQTRRSSSPTRSARSSRCMWSCGNPTTPHS